MEAERVQTSDNDIKQWYKELTDIISDMPAEFIYNMDETGCSEFVDSCEMTVIVPDEYIDSEIFIPIDRHSKRSTLTGCISADGKVLKPYVIIDRVTVDDQLILSGYGPSTAEFVTQKNAFMTMVLFEKWAQDIFFPALHEKRRSYPRYSGKADLIMNGFGAHSTAGFIDECKKENVVVKFLVPHTSDRCQPLDSLVFASLKSQYARKRVEISTSPQTNRIVRMMRAWRAATAPDIIVSSFKAVGIIPFIEKDSNEFIVGSTSSLASSSKILHLLWKLITIVYPKERSLELPK
jgi:hypothetical protein